MNDILVPFPIVVGVDFDSVAAYALDHASSLAVGTSGAALHLCRAVDLPWGVEGTADRLDRELAALQELARARLSGSVLADAKIYAAFGKPADVLVQLAADVEASLLVIGSHRRRGLERMVEGSVAHRLVTNAPCPVLIALVPDYDGLSKTSQTLTTRPGDPVRTVTGGTLYRLSRTVSEPPSPLEARSP